MSMTHRFIATALAALLASATFVAAQPSAHAFCGFYVGGAGQQMFNDATQVVMMREGTTTILSMRNNYQGPPTDFAMVVPVPQILSEETVKVLDDAVFDRVDKLTAPRLVEYWEQDPCYQPPPQATYDHSTAVLESAGPMPRRSRDKDTGVTIEAQFDVGEYEIVILSAEESNGLERWLDQNDYNIPDGAAKVLDPYITQGMYFFVAKVNPDKVDFAKDGTTMLSPLRFHYTSEDFSLPVRLGLLNARGPQDLIINILAREQRFEMANYENVAIPTNLHVAQTVRDNFAQFYVALFDFVLEENPGAVVTEYSWGAQGCDPCPSPPLDGADMLALGADVVVGQPGATKLEMDKPLGSLNWVVTRLHARYTLETLKDDLVFRAAPPIVGGRGMP